MGNKQGNGAKKHGVEDGAVFDEKAAEALGRKNVSLPKFIKQNHPAPSGMSMEKITVPYEPDKDKFCILIRNVFTKKECRDLIKLSEKQKYGPAYVRTRDNKGQQLNLEGRNNSRVMIDSHEMANFFFKRVEKYVPKKWNNKKVITFNERLRFLRYNVGEYFKLHLDGPYQRDNGQRSWCTIVIYLNQGFKGGSTMLWDLRNYDNNKPVIPETGMVLCFQHDIWHEGQELIKGKKYIIRTDVMYEAHECKDDENKIDAKKKRINLLKAEENKNENDKNKDDESIQILSKEYVYKSIDKDNNKITCLDNDFNDIIFDLDVENKDLLAKISEVIENGEKDKKDVKIIVSILKRDDKETTMVSDAKIQ